ncbi:hypothetical protein Poli38472_005738 [Pythium oligandrum]|uniref:Methenyltetrahydrofolate cyclohydrolase n=1 Tax=Pythium oligandrum TaxID=41045 RepID=A0A8K1CT83_PYTOL|nr:hypothetical protein Poli38472_005738 [Pythium oligandrum]|eukprot:TMW68270.1 hypothetical protein Poli38472_005738 [Pythium oligandrum]
MLLLDGSAVSDHVQREELAPACSAFLTQHGRAVGLAVVVVGTRKDSATYVRMKQKASANVGMQSWKVQIELPEQLQQIEDGQSAQVETEELQNAQANVVQEIYTTIHDLNAREDVDGIIVQLPLPKFCDADVILSAIDPEKDVDGLHPQSHAALFQFATKRATSRDKHERERLSFNLPCTPAGCLEILDHHQISLDGKHVVVLGRSQIVGLPVSLLCLQRNATVTMCHSRTQNLPTRVREADVVIAAIGRPQFVKADWLKPGAVVIDVGINPVDDPSKKAGYRLVGDVDFDAASQVASAITPVPRGVGPMTVAMLLRNTVDTAYRRVSRHPQSA